MDHSLRCSFAAGDLRAHAQLIIEELPEDLSEAVDVYLYDEVEAKAISRIRVVLGDFFDGGHWSSSFIPVRNDYRWADLVNAAEDARRAIILNGLPAWKEDSFRPENA